jgi:hypothetical protein
MPECDSLVGGALSIGLGLLLLYKCLRDSYVSRLTSSLPQSPCGQVAEGMIKTSGRAVGAATVRSAILGLPCLVSQVEAETYHGGSDNKGWKSFYKATQSVPFYVGDATGQIWVDPTEAELSLCEDVAFSSEKSWKPKPGQLMKYGDMELTAAMLEQCLRQFYEQHTAGKAARKKLRFTEKNLMPGDAVTVVGPAYLAPPGDSSGEPIRIHRVHPADPFVIGDGTAEEIVVRMRKQIRLWRLVGIGFVAVGVAMIVSCFFPN